MSERGFHISRGAQADPFAPECGCGVAVCGMVDTSLIDPDCPQHGKSAGKTLRGGHIAPNCPGEPLPRRPVTEDAGVPEPEPVARIMSFDPLPLTALTTEDLRTVVWTVADSAGPTTDDESVRQTLSALGLGHACERPQED